MLRKVRRKEMRTIKKLIPEKNDSSTRVSSKLSSLQTLSTVISLLEGEAGRFADRWFRPSVPPRVPQPILCKGNSSLYRRNFSTAPLETRSGVDIRAQLKTGEACNRCTISIPSSQLSQYQHILKVRISTIIYEITLRAHFTHAYCVLDTLPNHYY